MSGAGQTVSYMGGAGPGRPGKTSSDVIAMTETAEMAKMWHQSIRPEDCVQDIPPCFAGIEVWLFDYPLTKAFFLTQKNKGF